MSDEYDALKNNEYAQLILSIDKREHDPERVKTIIDFWEEHGGIAQMESSHRCDYRIEGLYRDVEVNLGIENKVLTGDYFPSLQDLPTKLLESYQYYKEVALFIEEGNYSLKVTDDGLDAWIQNPAMQSVTGAEGIGKLSMMIGFNNSIAHAGVYVCPYRTIAHFPNTVSSILKSIVKPTHRGVTLQKPANHYQTMMNMMVWIEGIGVKTAEKGLKYIPNLERLCSYTYDELEDIFGKAHGKKVFHFLHDNTRLEECSNNWAELYEKNAPKRRKEVDAQIKANKSNKINLQPILDSPEKKLLNFDVIPVKEEKRLESNINQSILKVADITPIVPEPKIIDPPVRVQDVIDYIRIKPRTIKEVQEYFGFSPDYCFKTLMEFKNQNKIWYETKTKTWQTGRDKNPMPVVADVEMEIGV